MRVRTEAKRAAIVSAAQAAFQEAGFERASMAEIAARAETSKVTLYNYFPSKEALFVEATLEHRRPQFEPAFAALEAEGARADQPRQRRVSGMSAALDELRGVSS